MQDIPPTYNIPSDPVAKPRMTRADKWKKRPCVEKYRAWADVCRRVVTGQPTRKLPEEYMGVMGSFYLPMPSSYPSNKKKNLSGHLHYVRPDVDNLLKAVLDSLFDKDSRISFVLVRKFFVNPDIDNPRTCLTLFREGHIRKELVDYNHSVALWELRNRGGSESPVK